MHLPALIIVLVLAGALVVTAYRLGRLRRAVRRLNALVKDYARGDLSDPGEPDRPDPPRPAGELSRRLRTMARQLGRRLSDAVEQRNELEAVLGSMVEGVVAIDLTDRVTSLNQAAARMLGLDPRRAEGRTIQELVRNTALQSFITRTLDDMAPVQERMTLHGVEGGREQCHIEAQSALLRNAAGHRIGVLVVLHDVTRLRRLETVRRDFVANVSHELKTPVSAIKAAIETLRDTADHCPTDGRGSATRFMGIIARQADRLSAIIDDLLLLARAEQDQAAGRLLGDLRGRPIRPVIEAALETCGARADDRGVGVQVQCDPRLEAPLNPALLEQAVVNLLDNAVKYSPEGGAVWVKARRAGSEVVLEVTDQGRGIEPHHLPRIFERFYRTDRARSRGMGGTGLGLSIVKHVAEAHGGCADVDSRPGGGSTFRLYLPTADLSPDQQDAGVDGGHER